MTKREPILLDNLFLIRKGVFSTEDAVKAVGWPRKELHPVLFRLVKKGKLARIKRGLFCLVPPGTRGSEKGYPQNWFLIARALAADKPYFISHYSAMQLHGMTSQSIQTIFISQSVQRRSPQELRIPIRFVTVPKKRFWGLEEKWVTNEEKIWVSDRERTVCDILDRPDLGGGISEIARGLWLVKKEIGASKLVRYAKRFGSYAAAKRLGFLMETLGVGSPQQIKEMYQFIRSSVSYAFFDPTLKKTGRHLRRWRLRLNLEIAEIETNLAT